MPVAIDCADHRPFHYTLHRLVITISPPLFKCNWTLLCCLLLPHRLYTGIYTVESSIGLVLATGNVGRVKVRVSVRVLE